MKLPPYEQKDMSESLLQRHLRTWKRDTIYVGQNFYMFEWESDFVCKVRSGFWHEVECKISLSDFKADFRKIEKHECLKSRKFWRWIPKSVNTEEELEKYRDFDCYRIVKDGKKWLVYQRSATFNDAAMPNYFSYCVPWYLEVDARLMLPEYAGLIVLEQDGRLRDVVKPKLLHDEKYKDESFRLAKKFYYHWLHLQQNVERNSQEERIKELKATISWLKAEYKAATGYEIEDTL